MQESPKKPTHGEWTMVGIKDIVIPPDRSRKEFPHLDALIDSIRRLGLLHPLVVTKREDGRYTLNAGECRLKAVILLGWTEVPVTFWHNLTRYQQLEIELEENLKRRNPNWSEEVEQLRKLDELKREILGAAMQGAGGEGWTTAKTAEVVGQAIGPVREKIAFAKLLRERPDLKEKVKGLPLNVAMRQVKQISEAERVERLHKGGMLVMKKELLHGDCRELIKGIPDESVDLVLTDPPFGIPILEELESVGRGDSMSFTAITKHSDNASVEEIKSILGALMPELRRVLKPGGHVYMFFAMEHYEYIRSTMGLFELVANPVPLIWFKGRSTAPFMGYDYAACYEPIMFAYKPPRTRRLTSPCKSVLTEYEPIHAKDKQHPFEKPLKLLKYFIKQSTMLGQVVLDPFAGSGSTLVAARDVGRSGIGFELDKEHFLKAQARLITKEENHDER